LQNDYARWPWPVPPTSPRSRQRIYAAAFDADLRRLRTAHGASAIDAALKLIEQRSGRGERATSGTPSAHATLARLTRIKRA